MAKENTFIQAREDDRERVRDASDIVHVIGEHVALRAHGREHVGLCPFHDDHKPSMTVVPRKQIFHCFSCGAGGDVFTFIEKFHGMTFPEALEHLAQRAGIELTPRSASAGETSGIGRRELVAAAETAQGFFRTILKHEEHGRRGRELVARRGISAEAVEAFGIGASPKRWDGLVSFLRAKNIGESAYAQAGLLKKREDGGFYDTFRDRLMFPITNHAGQTVAFGARRIDDADEPKYLNSAQSPVFDKSATLYALAQASRAIQREGVAIVCEGYTDAIACHQAGLTNTVATLGTAFTSAHADVLSRYSATVVLLFDGDEAGLRAADRAVEVVFASPIDVRIAMLSTFTDAKDPDELLKTEGGADRLRAAVAGAPDVLEYRFARLRARLQGAGPAQVERELRAELARLVELGLGRAGPIRRQLMIRRLHEITGLSARMVAQAIPAGRRARPAVHTPREQRRLSTCEHLLGCVLAEPDLWAMLDEGDRAFFEPERFEDEHLAGAARVVLGLAERGPVSLEDVIRETDEAEVKQAAISLSRRMESEAEGSSERLREHFLECLRVAKRELRRRDDAAVSRIDQLRSMMADGRGDFRVLPREGKGAVSR